MRPELRDLLKSPEAIAVFLNRECGVEGKPLSRDEKIQFLRDNGIRKRHINRAISIELAMRKAGD